ncbi:MAG: DNA-deoxyinosine glycosylase [Clostridia bacterium]|nr:DNA-deoxyinosine glycosylase [Clostridia bacterium]
MIIHPIPPLYNEESELLILGSFPSVKSREQAFFYGHPQNRFWKVLAAVFETPTPTSIQEKKAFLLKNKVALWDVIASCEIEGSADSTIKNACANDLTPILENSRIQKIFVNGSTAKKYYDRYLLCQTGIEAILLPSTSPANAAWSLERLIAHWKNALLN